MNHNYPLRKQIIITINFILRIVYNFYKTSGTTRAGSLSFTMLLSFIPFTITMAGIFTGISHWLPISSAYIGKIERYVFANYIPHSGIEIYQQVKVFLLQSQELSLIGFLSLIVTTYLMMYALETQLNGLWSASSKFSLLNSLIIHTIFLVSSFGLAIIISTLSIYSHVFLQSATMNFLIDKSLITIVTVLMFTLCYKILPNHSIKISHAFFAALSATIIFNIAKKIFVLYIKYLFVNYHIIYGSLAFIPIFLIWIYVSCLNLLFCAEIIYGLESRFNRRLHLRAQQLFRSYIK